MALYGQWLGVISICLLIALGIVGFLGHFVFSIVGWVIAFVLLFVEVPFATKCCPTSPKFDSFIAFFENLWFRAVMYLCFSIVMFLSNIIGPSILIVCAVTLLVSSLCYIAGALMGQSFASSSILGGSGVDNVV
ncbi:unnamed protein product [Mucor fragilis]